MRGRIAEAGSRFFRLLSTVSIAGWVALATLFVAVSITIAASSIFDFFTDTTNIASGVHLTVYIPETGRSSAIGSSWSCGNTLVDSRDAKTYATVLIGIQCWMAENMNIGTMTAGINNQGSDCQSAAAIEKYCYSDITDNCVTYGGLYQWDQAMCGSTAAGAKGICPTGWHVPTDSEQHTLDSYLATGTCDATRYASYDCSPAGNSLQSGGASGFQGLLAGNRAINVTFDNQGVGASFWSSTVPAAGAWIRNLYSGQLGVLRFAYNQEFGFSVRCLKD